MIPMFWSDRVRNLGDCYGPVLTAAFTGERIGFASNISPLRRMITVGTIGQLQKAGTVDVWGAGFAGPRGTEFSIASNYVKPPLVRFVPHAARGPFSRQLLVDAGYDVPEIFGDPALMLDRLWPAGEVEKRWDLGVVLHMSENDQQFERYTVPDELAGSVKVFTTAIDREGGVAAVQAKVRELQSCRRILSTGLHALVLAEAGNIPCAHFDIHDGVSGRIRVDDASVPLDHRMRDFYAGCGESDVLTYRNERHLPTDWEAAIKFIDEGWRPLEYDPAPLLEAFPKRYGEFADQPVVSDIATLDKLTGL